MPKKRLAAPSNPSSAQNFLRRADRFWERRQRRAGGSAFSGYLLDESPAVIGERRFQGEWSDVRSLLRRRGVAHGRCLDLGCGDGRWLEALAGVFGRLEGWDRSAAMLRAARARLKGLGPARAVLHRGDIRRRRGRAAFDFIFVGGVLMYTPDAALAPLLGALRRLLRPGGLLLLRESVRPAGRQERAGRALRPGLLAAGPAPDPAEEDYVALYRSPAELRAALTRAGLALLEERPNRHYKFSDLSEDWLRRLGRLGLRLEGDPVRAEAWARRIWTARALLLWPEYRLRNWEIENRWFACVQASTASTWKAR